MAAEDFTIDFTDYKDTQGDYVPPGKYVAIIEDAELGQSTQKGTPQLTLWLRVIGTEYDGLTLVENLYLTKPSRFRFASFLKALGLKVPKGKAPFKARQFLNRRVIVVAMDNEYKGKIRTRVDEWERVAAGGTAPGTTSTDIEESDGLDEFGAGTDEDAVDLPDEEEFSFDGDQTDEEEALATGPGDEIPAPTTEEEVTAEAAPKAQAKAAPAPKAEAAPAVVAAPVEEPHDSLEDEVAASLAEDETDDPGPDNDADTGVDDDEAMEDDDELADLEDLEV